MDETSDCARVSPLLAELATGAATGYDRADALRHVAGCPACRGELAELSRVADDVLLLAPPREPPAGFESAVMRRLDPVSRRRVRVRLPAFARTRRPLAVRPLAVRLVAAAAALLVAAGAGAAVESWRTGPERRLADEYRQVLARPVAGPRSAAVTTDSGEVVGNLYLYQGSPAWVMVTITAAPQPGDYAMDLVTVGGIRYRAGVCPVTGRTGTIGYSLPVPIGSIAVIELNRPGVRLSVHPG
jgi:hypothetical protein